MVELNACHTSAEAVVLLLFTVPVTCMTYCTDGGVACLFDKVVLLYKFTFLINSIPQYLIVLNFIM